MNKYGRGLDTETVFTTTALLAMVTHPANMVMTIIPRAVASMANFERIQSYLLESSRNDQRLPLPSATDRPVSSVSSDHARLPAVLLENVTIQPNSKSNPILQGINLKIERGALVMCAGRVGTGKTTLAKAVLGEFRPSSGRVSISTKRVALCSQVPWLPSGSIKEVIRDSSTFLDENIQWYETVIDVCGLRTDIENLPDGDSTQIGSRGLNLSGGQRQRLVSLGAFLPIQEYANKLPRPLPELSMHDVTLWSSMIHLVLLMARLRGMLWRVYLVPKGF